MLWIDIILGIFLVMGIFRGLRNGLIVELASLVSLLLGILVAIKFSHLMVNFLHQKFNWNPEKIKVVGFALTVILVLIVVGIVARLLTGVANFAQLGLLNKLLGAILGLFKTILILSVLLNLFEKANQGNVFLSEESAEKSILYKPVVKISQYLYPSLTEWFLTLREKAVEVV